MASRKSSRLDLATKAATKTIVDAERKCEKSLTPPSRLPTTHGSILRDAKGYLQRIYTAVDQISRRGRTKPRTLEIVNGIIIKARCARVLTHLSPTSRAAYLAAIAKSIPPLGGRARVIAEQMQTVGLDNTTRRRLATFVHRFGFLLLSVCAYSKSFRFIFLQSHLGDRNRALWRDLCEMIESHAYNLELYTRSRCLDWNTPLTEASQDWDQIIWRSLHGVLEEHSAFTKIDVLGISDTEYHIRHEFPDYISHYHEWVVSSEPKTAYNPDMTYRINNGTKSQLVTERQVNIDSSVILDKPIWVNRNKWPLDDHRY
jgi:hypothetical protein